MGQGFSGDPKTRWIDNRIMKLLEDFFISILTVGSGMRLRKVLLMVLRFHNHCGVR